MLLLNEKNLSFFSYCKYKRQKMVKVRFDSQFELLNWISALSKFEKIVQNTPQCCWLLLLLCGGTPEPDNNINMNSYNNTGVGDPPPKHWTILLFTIGPKHLWSRIWFWSGTLGYIWSISLQKHFKHYFINRIVFY